MRRFQFNDMRLAIAALTIGGFVGSANYQQSTTQKPVKHFTESFSHKYFTELDKANTALQRYANTPCEAPEFDSNAESFVDEYKVLDNLESNIPPGEEEITKTHEIEAFIGFQQLASDSVTIQNDCIAKVK